LVERLAAKTDRDSGKSSDFMGQTILKKVSLMLGGAQRESAQKNTSSLE